MSGEPLLKHGPNDTYSSVFLRYPISQNISPLFICLWRYTCGYLSVMLHMWLYAIYHSQGPKHYAHTLHSLIAIMHIVYSLFLWHEHCFKMICIICLYLCLQQTIPPPQAAPTQPAIMQPSNEPPPYTESSAQRVNTDDLQKRQEVSY